MQYYEHVQNVYLLLLDIYNDLFFTLLFQMIRVTLTNPGGRDVVIARRSESSSSKQKLVQLPRVKKECEDKTTLAQTVFWNSRRLHSSFSSDKPLSGAQC